MRIDRQIKGMGRARTLDNFERGADRMPVATPGTITVVPLASDAGSDFIKNGSMDAAKKALTAAGSPNIEGAIVAPVQFYWNISKK